MRAQVAPYHRWLTLETPHFHVHVARGLEREGRVAGAAAEHAYAQLARELTPPRGTIDLVISDDADYSNGYATPLPNNRIVIFATPPVTSPSLRFVDDWLATVITHELTHIFQLDRARGVWGVGQRVFGRAPALFPNLYAPSWLTEGLAVYYESRLTQGGRLKSSEHRLLARTAAMEHRLPRLNQLSAGSPLFPGGVAAYAYGSLFVEYLARTRGDSGIGRLVEEQSGALIPFRLNRQAERAFGVSFSRAFDAWRDSVQRSVGKLLPPLPGWRELTTHGYYALDPRWLTDSTLVYASNDGRSTSAEYELTLSGVRRRLGRRSSLGPSVPLPDGGLLFAQLELETPNEVRSDLYVERDGRQRRLTRGMRLVQPDVRTDGAIVATQIAPTRSSLVLLDRHGHLDRTLRTGGPDETWSDARWSPDGGSVVTVRRRHGGLFSVVVIDLATDSSYVLDAGSYHISTPSWTRDGAGVVYTSEASGTPRLLRAMVSVDGRGIERSSGAENLFSAELSPTGSTLASVTLRADGYHVGIAPSSSLNVARSSDRIAVDSIIAAASRDTQPLAAGVYRRYSAWRSVLPRYWYPVIEAAPARGTRLGITTSGSDVIGRHFYDAYVTVPTTGMYPTAGLSYRYAGLRRPYVDLNLSQNYTAEFSLLNGGTANFVGTVLRRSQDASLAATFTRPRVRSYAAVSVGAGVERREFRVDPGEFLKQLPAAYANSYHFPRLALSAQWSNLQRPSLSISPEDGISLAVTARERFRADSARTTMSASVVGTAAGYKSLDLPGFAHHVVALRVAGGIADRRAATSLEVGGTSGTTIELVPGYAVGEGRRTFGVRGFPSGSVYGTRAAAGSLEYRAPLGLGGRGLGSLPLFFDRSSITAFADGGVATCGSLDVTRPAVPTRNSPRFVGVCAPVPRIGRTIASVGGELGLSAAVLDWDTPQAIRLGFAVPVAGRDLLGVRGVSPYLAFGLSF